MRRVVFRLRDTSAPAICGRLALGLLLAASGFLPVAVAGDTALGGSTVLAPYNKTGPDFESVPPLPSAPGYVARIGLDDPTQVEAALLRAESYYLAADFTTRLPPLVLVLHGSEVAIFFRENYPRYKAVVDLAARLSAFGVVAIKVCKTRIKHLGLNENNLYPFVGTVPFGPAELERLTKSEGYVYF